MNDTTMASVEKTEYEIFLSYRWKDAPEDNDLFAAADRIRSYTGLNVFIDREVLRSGNFKAILPGKVRTSYVFLPVVSAEYLRFGEEGGRTSDSDYCLMELKTAVKEGIKIVPVFLGPATDLGIAESVQTVTEEAAIAAASKEICTPDDIQILKKWLVSQNGVKLGSAELPLETRIESQRIRLSEIIFDSFCTSDKVPYYKQILETQAARLNPVRTFGWDTGEMTIENTYVPRRFNRHLTKVEEKEKLERDNKDNRERVMKKNRSRVKSA